MFKVFLIILVVIISFGFTEVNAVPDDGSRSGQESNQEYRERIHNEQCEAISGGSCGSEPANDDEQDEGKGGRTPSEAAQQTQEKIIAAVRAYVVPTSTRFFSLGNLNSGNEASLIISSGNEENNVIFRVIRLIAMLIGTVAILLYIVAGYFMIFSQGAENQLTKGKQIVTFTSLGLVLAFGAYMIVQLVMGLIYFST